MFFEGLFWAAATSRTIISAISIMIHDDVSFLPPGKIFHHSQMFWITRFIKRLSRLLMSRTIHHVQTTGALTCSPPVCLWKRPFGRGPTTPGITKGCKNHLKLGGSMILQVGTWPSNFQRMVWLVGLGPGGLGPSNRAPKNPNPFHFWGSKRNLWNLQTTNPSQQWSISWQTGFTKKTPSGAVDVFPGRFARRRESETTESRQQRVPGTSCDWDWISGQLGVASLKLTLPVKIGHPKRTFHLPTNQIPGASC